MVHHLFGFPTRLPPSITIINISNKVNVELALGIASKVCVALFLFVLGYGVVASGNFSAKANMMRVIKFMKIYLYYAAIYLFIGYAFFRNQQLPLLGRAYSAIDYKQIAFNLFAIKYDYNPEWWFAREYIIYVLLLGFMPNPSKIKYGCVATVSILAFAFASHTSAPLPQSKLSFIIPLMYWQYPFVMGAICAKFDLLKSRVLSLKLSMLSIIVAACILYGHRRFGANASMLLMPIFAQSLLWLPFNASSKYSKILTSIGKLSFPIWLIHTGFCYYYFQTFIYSVRYSLAILLLLLISCYFTSCLLDYVRLQIEKAVKYIANLLASQFAICSPVDISSAFTKQSKDR